MIQRSQSIYLFLVVVLMSFFLMFPIIIFETADETKFSFYSYGLKKILNGESQKLLSSWPLFVLVLAIAGINFYNIFLFHKRTLQMRLSIYNILLLTGLLALTFFYYWFIRKTYPEITYHAFKIAMVFPAVGIVLNIMAFGGIRKDELLVKTYERLRK